MPTDQDLEVVVLSDALGAEIRGIVLDEAIEPARAAALRTALATHHLLVLRGLEACPPEHQQALLSCFGELVDETGDGRRFSYVSNARADGVLAAGRALLFHSDNLFTPEPLATLSLYGEQIDGPTAPTCFANCERAWAHADPALRDALATAEVLNLSGFAGGWYRYRDAEVAPHHPRAVHPAVAPNPRTGRPALRVGEQQSDRLVGLDPAESEALLQQAFAVLYADDNVYAHHWRTGDLLVWDNLALQHGRPALAGTGERTLRRVVTVDGAAERQHTWGSVSLAAESATRPPA